jgi:hypothetical protein
VRVCCLQLYLQQLVFTFDLVEFIESGIPVQYIYLSLVGRWRGLAAFMGPKSRHYGSLEKDMENFRCFATRMDRYVSHLTGSLCDSFVLREIIPLGGVAGDTRAASAVPAHAAVVALSVTSRACYAAAYSIQYVRFGRHAAGPMQAGTRVSLIIIPLL